MIYLTYKFHFISHIIIWESFKLNVLKIRRADASFVLSAPRRDSLPPIKDWIAGKINQGIKNINQIKRTHMILTNELMDCLHVLYDSLFRRQYSTACTAFKLFRWYFLPSTSFFCHLYLFNVGNVLLRRNFFTMILNVIESQIIFSRNDRLGMRANELSMRINASWARALSWTKWRGTQSFTGRTILLAL